MMAKTHGLTEFAHTLEETLRTMDGIDADKVLNEANTYAKKGKALLPLRPVFVANDTLSSSDWPMINLRAKEAERAAQMFQKRKEPEIADSDDMFFDAKEYHTSNKQIANILTSAATPSQSESASTKAAVASMGNAKWGDEDEIDIDDDLMVEAGATEE